MTRLPLSLTGVLALLLSSCNAYQYVTPLPAVPQFEKAGEVQTQVAISPNHIEYQASVSPIHHFGLTYNGFRAFRTGSKMDSYTLHTYWQTGQEKTLFLTGSIGYDRGSMESKDLPSLFPGTDYDRETFSSEYQVLRFGVGAYHPLNGSERKKISLDLNYQLVQFSKLSSYYYDNYSRHWRRHRLIGNTHYHVISPMVTYTIKSARNGIFYYRHTFGLNIPLGSKVTVSETHSYSTAKRQPFPTAILPKMGYLICAGTIGIRLNVLEQLIRLGEKPTRLSIFILLL
jgi:hypothetical protein